MNKKTKNILLAIVVILICFVIGFLIGKFLYDKYEEHKKSKNIAIVENIDFNKV